MSLITIVKRNLRKWAISRLQQDLDWARASSDAHIQGLERQIERLRDKADSRSAQDVARDVCRREKGFA